MQVRHGYRDRVERASWKGNGVQMRAYVEPELRRHIIETARRDNITLSEVMRRAIRAYYGLPEIR